MLTRRLETVRSSEGQIALNFVPSDLVASGVCDELNADSVSRFLTAYVSLLGDSPLSKPHNIKPRRVILRFVKQASRGPLRDLIKRYSSLAEQITSTCYTTGQGPLTGDFVDGMKDTPIFKEYLSFYRSGSPEILTYILSFLKFGKKLDYDDESLHHVAFRDWLGVESRLTHLSLPDYVADLRQLIRWLLPHIRTDSFYPKFGPGAVANSDIRGTISKSNNLRRVPLIDRAFFSPFYKMGGDPPPLRDVVPDLQKWLASNSRELDHSVLRFVPKDVSKSRSICMEPNTHMYFQQMVHDWMRDSIRSGPLRHYIHLEDQNFNREAALHGSLYGSMDTIDLSSASDSVSMKLVKDVFPRDFLYYMLATRTSKVKLPDGSITSVQKFAPMGSAVCFPTQCIIFCSVVIYSMMLNDANVLPGTSLPSGYLDEEGVRNFLYHHVHSETDWFTPFTSRYERPQVYGDDIVCDSRVTDTVTHILSDLGFIVNDTKSYRGAQAIRESCGEWYFNGYRITPFTYRVKASADWLTPTAFASLISAINNCRTYGYHSLRRTLIRYALYSPLTKRSRKRSAPFRPNRVRFVSSIDEFGIVSNDTTNPHLKRRYNRDLQLDEVFCEHVIVKKQRGPNTSEKDALEHYLYSQHMRTRYREVSPPDFMTGVSRYRPEETGLAGRWIPCRE